jgi:DUF1009 family protein
VTVGSHRGSSAVGVGYRPLPLRRRFSADGSQSPAIGLIAGWGRFPVLVAESLVRSRIPVVCVALKGLADPSLEYLCDDVRWYGVAKLGGHQRYFQRLGVKEVTMAGKLFKADLLFRKSVIFSNWPDLECVRTFAPHFIFRREDTRDDNLLNAITHAYERKSMAVISATDYAPDLLVGEGFLTERRPSQHEMDDIQFGWSIAKTMGGWDIGQSITVRDGTVIAIEAVEGTDACIDRTGPLCRKGGWTLIKVAKPLQDMRFDVPTIGPLTVQRVADGGGTVIAIEAGKTIMVDREETARLADRLGVAIVALKHDAIESREPARVSARPDQQAA